MAFQSWSGALASLTGAFDVVTAIEVIEHVPEPLELLGRISTLAQARRRVLSDNRQCRAMA